MPELPTPPENIYWLPMLHPCSDVIDWGVEATPAEITRLDEFLIIAAQFPCPWHGSATGVPSNAGRPGPNCLLANNIWYQEGQSDRAMDALRNRQLALARAGLPGEEA